MYIHIYNPAHIYIYRYICAAPYIYTYGRSSDTAQPLDQSLASNRSPNLSTFPAAMKKGQAYIFSMDVINGHAPQAPPVVTVSLLPGTAPGGFSSVCPYPRVRVSRPFRLRY